MRFDGIDARCRPVVDSLKLAYFLFSGFININISKARQKPRRKSVFFLTIGLGESRKANSNLKLLSTV